VEPGVGNILSPDDNVEELVATCGAFDGLGMLQQNKGCSSLCGPVAQLGARFHGMEEVIGSIPIRSTNSPFRIPGAGNFIAEIRIKLKAS
jgi:hypothetical protein